MNLQLENAHMELLEIRYKHARRNATLMGAVFLAAFLAFFLRGMLGFAGEREPLLLAAILVAMGFSLMSAWARYEASREVLAFARMLSRDSQAL